VGTGVRDQDRSCAEDHAFKEMDLPRLVSLIAPENAASERVAMQVGMTLAREITRPVGEVRRVYVIERTDEAP